MIIRYVRIGTNVLYVDWGSLLLQEKLVEFCGGVLFLACWLMHLEKVFDSANSTVLIGYSFFKKKVFTCEPPREIISCTSEGKEEF